MQDWAGPDTPLMWRFQGEVAGSGALGDLAGTGAAYLSRGMTILTAGAGWIALAIVAAMSLGVVVDDTVHFVAHVLDGRRRLGLPPR